MKKTRERLSRLDVNTALKARLLPFCRLQPGEVWDDPLSGHRVGVLDAASRRDVARLLRGEKTRLSVHDPPYNVSPGSMVSSNLGKRALDAYLAFSRAWVENALRALDEHAHLYIWMGADYQEHFQPLPDFMLLMREFADQVRARNLLTLRNQRGYGTQYNWMWLRQELLYYVKGQPAFNVAAEYTDIPKILRGYYKTVRGRRTENLERSKAETIRAGNVWVDLQQVFYRREENVPGCYAQKPLKALERIVLASTAEGELVSDFFAHAGTTLLAGERLKRRVLTCDIDPVFAEITIRRLEHYRRTGKTGWQWAHPFPEVALDEAPG
ncbi:MAG: site-specific DNA-methyltransferase [Candidatus Tectimicrobiota bacterium]